MRLSEISIRRPIFAWMLMAALMFFGGISFLRLGVSQLPDVTFPILTVVVTWPGADPTVLEHEVVDPLEEVLISVHGIKGIESTLRQGVARIKLEFYMDRDMDAALQEAYAKIQSVKLPTDADRPRVYKINQDENPIMWLSLAWNRPYKDLIRYVDLNVRDKFLLIPGVGDIQLGGWADRNLRVWVDRNKLAKWQLSILDVQNTLAAGHVQVPSGYLEGAQNEFSVRFIGEGTSPEEVARIPITARGDISALPITHTGGGIAWSGPLHLGDVATVEDSLMDMRRLSRRDGKQALSLGVQKLRGYNEIEVARRVREVVQDLQKTLPPGMDIKISYDSSRFTELAVRETEFTVLLSGIITAVVCLLFLGSLNSTINVIFAIPTSILGTFLVIHFMGFTLNYFTLLALSLAMGIVVDDAIMVLENIVRHFHMGKPSDQAALDGTGQIRFAALATTLSIVAVFAPVLFVGGVIGRFLFQFGVTICSAVLLSLLEALTFTPMRCAQFLSQAPDGDLARRLTEIFGRFAQAYAHRLEGCLKHPWLVTGASAGIFLASLALVPKLHTELAPTQDLGMVLLRIHTPVGSSLTYTGQRVKLLEDFLRSQPYVEKVLTAVGGYYGGETNEASMFITLVPREKRSVSQTEVMEIIRKEVKKYKDLKLLAIDLSQVALSTKHGANLEISLQGSDYEVLRQKTYQIMRRMEASGFFTDMDTDFRQGVSEVRLIPDREKANLTNVSILSIAQTVAAAIGGARQGQYTHEQDLRRYDLRLRLLPSQWSRPEDVLALNVWSAYGGEPIPLKDIAHIELARSLVTVTRENRHRAITLYANVKPGVSQGKAMDRALQICRETLPPGYLAQPTGISQTTRESFAAFPLTLVLGFVVAYMVLAAQFNSFLHPITVFVALPFSLTGSILALYLTGHSLNLYSGIGMILLMGIAKKNSILLVDFFNAARARGAAVERAILQGAKVRLRPILMTSLATVAGAVPPALGLGPGAEVRVPLAVVVIGGVSVATFFTLFVVPCVYRILIPLERRPPSQMLEEEV
jgi:hydrophobe/amphiphile efflux-1 (HAE1) family protein